MWRGHEPVLAAAWACAGVLLSTIIYICAYCFLKIFVPCHLMHICRSGAPSPARPHFPLTRSASQGHSSPSFYFSFPLDPSFHLMYSRRALLALLTCPFLSLSFSPQPFPPYPSPLAQGRERGRRGYVVSHASYQTRTYPHPRPPDHTLFSP